MKLLLKYLETARIAISAYLAYRLNFLLEFSGPALVYFLVKYNVWIGIYGGSESSLEIQGYTLSDMLHYQSWTLISVLLIQSYNGSAQAVDIRMGRISSFLLYPFGFWNHHIGKFMGFFVIQTVIAAATLLVFLSTGMIEQIHIAALAQGYCICMAAALFWFTWNFLSSIIAFWLEETWFFRVIMLLIVKLLSGSLLPLEFFPEALATALRYTPFPYLTYFPTKAFIGESENFGIAVLAITLWTILLGGLCAWTWRVGVRRYSAAGI